MTIPNGVEGYELHLKETELNLRERELELKRRDVENTAHEMLNTFLRDNRTRVDSLIKSILLISGGALTLSIGSFLRPDHPTLSIGRLCDLRVAWMLLFGSMVLSVLVMLVMIVSSDLHGKRWEKFQKKKEGELEQPKHLPKLAWTLGITGVICCCAGLVYLAAVAVSTLT